MSSIDEKLRQQLEHLRRGKINCFPATVKAVDKDSNTITVVDALELEYDDVRLTAVAGGVSGLICYPAIDSSVLVNIINDQENELVASHFETVEELTVNVGDTTMLIDKDGIQLNGDDFTMLKGAELLAEVQKTNARIDAIVNVLTGAPVTEPGNGAPSAFQAALNSAVAPLQAANYTNLENTKVKHG